MTAATDFASRRSRVRWVLYATWDEAGREAPHAVAQLRAYRRCGFETLVIDASPSVGAGRRSGWDSHATAWLQRENVGYDFGSFRDGLDWLATHLAPALLDDAEIVLATDSCYGPFTPMEAVFREFDAVERRGPTVFGLTDSDEHGHHLQSYWLYFARGSVPILLEFVAAMPLAGDRSQAIAGGELALSRFLEARGVDLVARQPTHRLIAHFAAFRWRGWAIAELALRRRLKRPKYTPHGDAACLGYLLGRPPGGLNPCMVFGTHLYLEGLLPLVKRQLIRENPAGDPLLRDSTIGEVLDNSVVPRLLGPVGLTDDARGTA